MATYLMFGRYSSTEAMQASAAMAKLTGISFRTVPAIGIEAFDKLVA
jgi:hypothetical protein